MTLSYCLPHSPPCGWTTSGFTHNRYQLQLKTMDILSVRCYSGTVEVGAAVRRSKAGVSTHIVGGRATRYETTRECIQYKLRYRMRLFLFATVSTRLGSTIDGHEYSVAR